ncbi:MAG: hypothetical protein ACXVAX_07620 [Pseudobdellovibrio sp.]
MNMKASFVSFLNQKYPQLKIEQLNDLISEQLLSPFQVHLTQLQADSIQKEISQYWKLRNWGATHLKNQYEAMGLSIPNNNAVCMSYDFHINAGGKPELIEINTNAAFLAMGLELNSFLGLPTPEFSEQQLIEMFKEELRLIGASGSQIAIIDENPNTQRLYVEFLVYQQLFNKHGLHSEIFDYRETDRIKKFDLIYNRYTDFFLQAESSIELKKLFNSKNNFSPNPYEYMLLADKQRLLDWNNQTEVEKPQSLLSVYDLGIADKEKIWQERKHLFIKPKNSYGSKQAYRASSISRKMFDEIYGSHFIAQQLSTPSEVEVVLEGKPEKLKYDLRCYAYQDKLQMMIARLYQGQTTNLKTIGGGFAAVKIS